MSTNPVIHSNKLKMAVVAGAASLALAVAGGAAGASAVSTRPATKAASVKVTIGYFPNITHAPALVGVQEGIFARQLSPDKLATPEIFSAGPSENVALLAGSVDIGFEGPSSALSAYTQSHGAIKIIAGVATGGAGLVVNKSITTISQLKGTTLGTPELGNTQDIALRYWLKEHGLTTTTTGGGEVHIEPSSTGSGTVVTEFKDGDIDGAWMAEPYEQELIADGGHLLEAETGETTDLVVRSAFLKAHPATVSRFLTGLIKTLAFMKSHKLGSESAADLQLSTLQGGKVLSRSVLEAAWDNISFSDNPHAPSLQTQVTEGEAVGLLKNPGNISAIFDLKPLNTLLKASGQPLVPGI